jgi:hypothetical protein
MVISEFRFWNIKIIMGIHHGGLPVDYSRDDDWHRLQYALAKLEFRV